MSYIYLFLKFKDQIEQGPILISYRSLETNACFKYYSIS